MAAAGRAVSDNGPPSESGDFRSAAVSLWDWRRRVARMWQEIRDAGSPEDGWLNWVTTRDDLFLNHPQTPLEPGAAVPEYFDYNSDLRFEVELVAPTTTHPMFMPAGNDGDVKLLPFAETSGLHSALGGELTLYWVSGYGGGVFLPFLDATSGKETYGGGRYLLDTIKSADHGAAPNGRIILDFNFAYHPSCYYSPRWVCPLAPRDRRLPVAVRAGEKLGTGY